MILIYHNLFNVAFLGENKFVSPVFSSVRMKENELLVTEVIQLITLATETFSC